MKNKQNLRLRSGKPFSFSRAWQAVAAGGMLLFGLAASFDAASQTLTIKNTKHNFSYSSGNTVKTSDSTQTEICVFCHTPHGANSAARPLWNRNLSGAAYTRYTSASLDANNIADGFKSQPAGTSLLCLSCHDGTVAIGSVLVRGGKLSSSNIAMTGTNPGGTNMVAGGMPEGGTNGSKTGFTRLIGSDLSNDHPISITYNSDLVNADGELRSLDGNQRYPASTGTVIGVRYGGYSPLLPLQRTSDGGQGQVQCPTCHDPHVAKSKFLRLNRFQVGSPGGGEFSPTNDIICLACHTKGGTEWSQSIHAISNVSYAASGVTLREFPTGTTVWQAACLNCHDTHTVPGSRRLLREGIYDPMNTLAHPKVASSTSASAIEETCYQCHNAITPASGPPNALSFSTLTATTGVPNIKGEFTRAIRMPIRSGDQGGGGNTTEVHQITNADFIESVATLGKGYNSNRHVECTDCHNPHRVIKNERYDGAGVYGYRTHIASGTTVATGQASNGNVASGVLRGMWGVLPSYTAVASSEWPKAPSYTEVKGIPGVAASPLTREYQLCFKCHSDYSNTLFPALRGNTYGGTNAGTNGLNNYTNVASEFAVVASDPPVSAGDQGEYGESTYTGTPANEDNLTIEPSGSLPGDAAKCFTASTDPCMTDADTNVTYNHRSWHPVIWPTGRTRDERRMASTGGNFRAPFDTKVGIQTMYCSDCHGDPGSWTTGGPDRTKVQGPHGSDNNFLLKGVWTTSVTIGGGSGICFNCHNPDASTGTGDNAARVSGFNNSGEDGGGGHANEHTGRYCMRCHIAVPHGWKNKAFLVNLNCVGAEVGKTSCDPVSGYAGYGGSSTYSAEPYYYQASLRVRTWRQSGNWTQNSCGMNATNARGWMRDSASC